MESFATTRYKSVPVEEKEASRNVPWECWMPSFLPSSGTSQILDLSSAPCSFYRYSLFCMTSRSCTESFLTCSSFEIWASRLATWRFERKTVSVTTGSWLGWYSRFRRTKDISATSPEVEMAFEGRSWVETSLVEAFATDMEAARNFPTPWFIESQDELALT